MSSRHKLPPLRSLYNLHLNPDFYPLETENLLRMHKEHGLMIWDPQRLDNASRFKSDSFCFFVDKFMRITRWFVIEDDYDPYFPWYLIVEFVLQLLDGTTGITDFNLTKETLDDYYLEFFALNLVRKTVAFLWENNGRFKCLLEKFFIALLDHNAFDILHVSFNMESLNSLDYFVAIVKNIKHRHDSEMSSKDLLAEAKDLYHSKYQCHGANLLSI